MARVEDLYKKLMELPLLGYPLGRDRRLWPILVAPGAIWRCCDASIGGLGGVLYGDLAFRNHLSS